MSTRSDGVNPRRMPNGAVQLAIADGVATVTLDRPESLNSMNDDLMDDITSAVHTAEADPSVGVLVITGAGRGFCSGADLKAVDAPSTGERDDAAGASHGAAIAEAMDAHFTPAAMAIKHCAVPTVARVNGAAAGGGFGLALACDIAIAAHSAFFVATFGPRLGIVPDVGTTWTLPKSVGIARAKAIAMLGERVTAEQAASWGLIHAAVPDDELDAEVERVTSILKVTSGEAMQRIRSSIESASQRTFAEQLDLERDHQVVLIPKNMAEGAAAFREKREPRFR